MDELRIDKFLWAARFYKTRSLAQEMVSAGKVKLGGQTVKPSRVVRVGDVLDLRQGRTRRKIEVLALSDLRGPASVAAGLYTDLEPPETTEPWKRR